MKFLLLILFIISFGVCDDYTLKLVGVPTLGDISIDSNDITYTHIDTNDINTPVLDSFVIIATDEGNNTSELTRLYVLIIPKFEMQLYIVPNPMEIIGHNVNTLSTSFTDHFNISIYGLDNEGAAIVLLFDRDIDPYKSTGRFCIKDAVGNSITQYIPIHFGKTTDGQSMGISVWNGRNLNNRVVGPESFIVYVEVHVVAKTKLENTSNELDKTFIKVIGVKYK